MKNNPTLTKLVIQEAMNLKKFATAEELSNLNEITFNPESNSRCFYGQMVGNCKWHRANELIQKCCEKVYNRIPTGPFKDPYEYWNKLEFILNGAPTERESYWSPMEIWGNIVPKTESSKIIKFLKGETKTLSL